MSRTRLILSISDNSDFFPSADYAVIELTPESNERIRKLAVVVQQMKVYRISEFNYDAEFMVADYEADPDNGKAALKEFDGRMECTMLNVTDTGFYWSGLYRHTDIRWSSDTVPLAVLKEPGTYDQREEYQTGASHRCPLCGCPLEAHHTDTHLGIERKIFECQECDERFIRELTVADGPLERAVTCVGCRNLVGQKSARILYQSDDLAHFIGACCWDERLRD